MYMYFIYSMFCVCLFDFVFVYMFSFPSVERRPYQKKCILIHVFHIFYVVYYLLDFVFVNVFCDNYAHT